MINAHSLTHFVISDICRDSGGPWLQYVGDALTVVGLTR